MEDHQLPKDRRKTPQLVCDNCSVPNLSQRETSNLPKPQKAPTPYSGTLRNPTIHELDHRQSARLDVPNEYYSQRHFAWLANMIDVFPTLY